jgi:predicted AAA+ superfamily ATPase
MKQIIDFLIQEKDIKKENIIYIDKEDLQFDNIKDYSDLYDYIENKVKDIKGKVYLFVDEIQDIKDWEKTIRNYVKNDKFDIYITGSNSNLLSSELSTFLTGRYVEFHIYPLDFKEFLEFRKVNDDNKIKEEFKNYMKYG